MAEPAAVRGTPPMALQRAFEIAARGLRRMGRGRYVIADAAGELTYALQPPGKRMLCRHLHSRAAGGLPPAEARRRARASYRNYSRMIVDTVWIHAIGLDEMFEHGTMEGVEHLDNARASGKGGILSMVHFGSWDIAASMAYAAGHPVTTVMAPVGPQWITDLLAWSRKAKEMVLFTPSAAARGLIRTLREGRIVALLVDIPEGGPTTDVEFANGPVRFSTGPAFLARLTGASILPIECWAEPDGYRVHIYPPMHPEPGEDDQAVMQRLATLLDARRQAIPEQWYPFNPYYADERDAPGAAATHARQAS